MPVGQCSATCGRGERRQKSECIRSYVDGGEDIVSDAQCRQLKKPSDHAPCYVDCSGRKWAYTDWTPVCLMHASYQLITSYTFAAV